MHLKGPDSRYESRARFSGESGGLINVLTVIVFELFDSDLSDFKARTLNEYAVCDLRFFIKA